MLFPFVLLLFIAFIHPSQIIASQPSENSNSNSNYIPTTELPQNHTYSPPHQYGSSSAESEIRNKIAFSALILDRKSYSTFSKIFVPDVTILYPNPPPDNTTDLPTFQRLIEEQLRGLITEHIISTTVIEFDNVNDRLRGIRSRR